MKFESFRTPVPRSESSEEIPQEQLWWKIGGLERFGDHLIDKTRRITYPLAFIASFIAYENAHGVEIPKNASLQEGITLLREAAVTEEFETAALYFQTETGSSVWHSNEGSSGEPGEVPRVTPLDGAWVDSAKNQHYIAGLIKELGAEPGSMIIVKNLHNHPDTEHASSPPSGFGYMYPFQDTAKYVFDVKKKFWMGVAEFSGHSINMDFEVVDPSGIWRYSVLELDNPALSPEFKKLYEQWDLLSRKEFIKSITESELAELEEISSRMRGLADNLERLQFEWHNQSKNIPVTELINNDLYDQLINAYSSVGVQVTYDILDKDGGKENSAP